jgi:hypothetical protein
MINEETEEISFQERVSNIKLLIQHFFDIIIFSIYLLHIIASHSSRAV